ncbi:hypothetical protein ACN38_g11736 [Penicillium nordicum]|uniref:Uncharacterized protein n=1 Tax=Penicillium nordicum TaxID=229535 RepID=A0A0M8NUE2_9EURO|nr:hypothetical protein ACN38_g11736 [Penicillium nordicum]
MIDPDYIFDCTDTSPIFYLCGYPFRSILSHYWCLGALTSTPPHYFLEILARCPFSVFEPLEPLEHNFLLT